MAVRASESHLPTTPWLIRWWLEDFGALCGGADVEVVDRIDSQVGHLAVIA